MLVVYKTSTIREHNMISSHVLHASRSQRFICAILVVSMVAGPSLNVLAQSPAAANPPKAATVAKTIDTTYVLPSAVGFALLRPAQIMKSPMSELLPIEVATAAGLKYF